MNLSEIVNKSKFEEINFEFIDKHIKDKLPWYVKFEITHITPLDVKQLIDKLDANKSCGIDGIGPKILKHCGDNVTIPLASIINKCIDKCVFPDSLKEAFVIPIHKGGDKNDPSNYRPISILPTISKIFEWYISNQMQDYLNKYNLIHNKQSGFRQNH